MTEPSTDGGGERPGTETTRARRASLRTLLQTEKTANRVLLAGPVAIAVGLLVVVAYSAHVADAGAFLALIGTLFALALASLAAGGFIGFLFGIPRVAPAASEARAEPAPQAAARPETSGEAAPARAADAATSRDSGHRVNTNLEEVSDWLTKIIVGVSLVEFKSIAEFVDSLSLDIAGIFQPACTGAVANCFLGVRVFSAAEIILFFLIGIHFGFLWTRLLVQGAIKDADLSLVAKFEQQREELDERVQQDKADADAIHAVGRVLDGSESIAKEELKRALGNATQRTRAVAFYRARNFRQEHDRTERESIGRVIPIFEALIELDVERTGGRPIYHRNYAQLAYVRKDKTPPDYAGAIEALDAAIRTRPADEAVLYALYEFNRAVCRMQLDKQFAAGAATDDEEIKQLIVSDLSAACRNEWIRDNVIPSDDEVQKWLKLNKITLRT